MSEGLDSAIPAEAMRGSVGARAATEAQEEVNREEALREHRESWAPPSLEYTRQVAEREAR